MAQIPLTEKAGLKQGLALTDQPRLSAASDNIQIETGFQGSRLQ